MRIVSLLVLLLMGLPALAAEKAAGRDAPWVALHLLGYQNDKDLEAVEGQLGDLAARGVNVSSSRSTTASSSARTPSCASRRR
jgi:hypothetical protein